MKTYTLSHLTDPVLERDLATLDNQHRHTTAALLAHLAEFDERRLYLPAAFPSLFLYCVHQLRWCEQAAFKRIRAARTARRFPAIFPALAAGHLHLSAVVLLAPYLTPENADELLTAATHKTKSEIEQLIVERFPRLEVPALVQAMDEPPIQAASSTGEPAPGRADQLSPGTVGHVHPETVVTCAPRPKLVPLAPQRYALQLTVSQGLRDKLRYAQELLSHQVPAGDVAQVLERALDALIPQLEKSKFAATRTPRRRQPRASAGGRHVPAHVKRAVWERDGGRCTFVSEAGRRCAARTWLELDHIDEVARGGRATLEGIRLRCRAHNQYGAECTFGVEFMRHKRHEARATRAAAAAAKAKAQDVIPWLRALGFGADEARRAAQRCESIPDASLEERVRLALTCFRPVATSPC